MYQNIVNKLTTWNTQLVCANGSVETNAANNLKQIIKLFKIVHEDCNGEITLCDNLLLVVTSLEHFNKHILEPYENNQYALHYKTPRDNTKIFIFKKLFILDYSSYNDTVTDDYDPNIICSIMRHFNCYDFKDQNSINSPNKFNDPNSIVDSIKKEMIQPNILLRSFMHFYCIISHRLRNKTYLYET